MFTRRETCDEEIESPVKTRSVVGRGHIGVMESGMGGDTGEEEVLPGWGPPTRGSR